MSEVKKSTAKKSTTKKTTAKKTTVAKALTTSEPVVTVPEPIVEAVVTATTPQITLRSKPALDKSMEVYVRNGFAGKLTYVSRKTGYVMVLNQFGDGDYMTLEELMAAKNSQIKFFEKNWFIIDDPEVIAWLGVGKFYQNCLSIEEFDNIFFYNDDEMSARIMQLSDGQKASLSYCAAGLIASGQIDSKKKIGILEELFGVKFEQQ